jgi:hypothetical protein
MNMKVTNFSAFVNSPVRSNLYDKTFYDKHYHECCLDSFLESGGGGGKSKNFPANLSLNYFKIIFTNCPKVFGLKNNLFLVV